MEVSEFTGTRLLYVYDVLCGWCYGFGPVIEQLSDEHPEWPVEVISGGMITGDRQGPLAESAGYIKQAYPQVEKASGVRFGKAFTDGALDDPEMYSTSVPASALLAYARERRPTHQLAAARALQTAFFDRGYGPATEATADFLAERLDLDRRATRAAATDDEYLELGRADFALAKRFGIQGFPAVVLQHGGRLTLLSNGFLPLETLRQQAGRALSPENVS